MIRFVTVQIKPYQSQNNLDILVDNNVCQQYFNAGQNLVIEAEFRNTIIQEINLNLSPSPEKDILYKCYNLNELDQEYKRINGKLIKIRNEENYSSYTAFIKSEVPYTRLTITIQTDKIDYFKIYYFGVKGKNIEEELELQGNQESIDKKKIKVILKLGRKTENFNSNIIDTTKMTAMEFLDRIKSGKTNINREQQSNSQDDKIKIEQSRELQENERFSVKMQEETKVKEDPDGRQYITLQDDDENSVQFIEEKVKTQQINNNHLYQQKCSFSGIKPHLNNQINTKQLNINSESKQHMNYEYNNMIKYTAIEIDQQFLQFHKTIEENKNVNAKNRLIHRLNTQQY